MRVGEALLQAQHLFADDLKAKMPGLDDPGMHRADRNLVHAVAVDAHERIILLARRPLRQDREVAAQRKAVDRPRGLPQPRPLIVGFALDADEIERRTLHPVRRREDRREIRVARALVGKRVLEQRQAVAILEQHVQAEAALAVALVARPQRDELPALFPGEPAGGEELRRGDRAALGRYAAGERRGGDAERGKVHRVSR